MIIGLTGKYAAGEGVVAEYFKKKGFGIFSLSDVLREEAKKRKIKVTRANLIKLGNELRKKYGYGILSKRIIKKFKGEYNVVDIIRHPSEIKELKKYDRLF